MGMIPPIQRGGSIRHHLVIGDVILVDFIDVQRRRIRCAENRGGRRSQIARESDYGDVHDVVAKPAAIRPSARNDSVSKSGLNLALKYVSAKNAEPMEAGIIGVAG